jgi:hypothetical protein
MLPDAIARLTPCAIKPALTPCRALMMPLNVAATFVKLAIPPPMIRILPSGRGGERVIRSTGRGRMQIVNRYVIRHDSRLTDRLCVLVRLALRWRATVLAVVGELVCETSSCDGVRVHDGGTSTCDHGPDASIGVQNGEFQRSPGGSIQFLDVCYCKG